MKGLVRMGVALGVGIVLGVCAINARHEPQKAPRPCPQASFHGGHRR